MAHLRTGPTPPCLILLDIMMPVMDGLEFRSALFDDPRSANIPVIVITALESSVARGFATAGILTKPVDIDALLWLVRQHC